MTNHRCRHTQTARMLIVVIVAVVLAELTIVTFSAPQDTVPLALSGAAVAVAAVMPVFFLTLAVMVDTPAVRI